MIKFHKVEVLMDYGDQVQVMFGKSPIVAKKGDGQKYEQGDTGEIYMGRIGRRDWWIFNGDPKNDETEETCEECLGEGD